MRISIDLLNSSLSYLNPLKEWELDLRGHKIPMIENLGGVSNHGAIDLTDNDISTISGFPLMPRLNTLLLARNRVAAISSDLDRSIPNLRMLALEGNRIAELADLDSLSKLSHLEHLVLLGNPVCKNEHYRSWVLWRLPSIRYLDFQKVKDSERKAASELFGPQDHPFQLAKNITENKSRDVQMLDAFGPTDGDAHSKNLLTMTNDQRERVKERIKSARTLDEAMKLEAALSEGKISSTLLER